MTPPGIFTISLDFELYWGVRDHRDLQQYGDTLLGARKAIPELLALFKSYELHATWATVGLLFLKDKDELGRCLPALWPNYEQKELSPYIGLQEIGNNETNDPYHYGAALIRQIQATPHQELGSHTFSHYYCLEKGQSLQAFEEDLDAAVNVAQSKGVHLKSIVFPRNQYAQNYIEVCQEKGFSNFRGNENSWLYAPRSRSQESIVRRAFRLADTYVNISGNHTYELKQLRKSFPYNVPSSRFLRPYSSRLRLLEPLKLKRITKAMTKAAKNRQLFHLWWHPHNFGQNLEENLTALQKIAEHYQQLKNDYNMISCNMGEVAKALSVMVEP